MKNKVSRKAGFTLVEIMIVVAIIGLLAAIAIPNFVRARTTSQQNACINNLRLIDGASSNGRWSSVKAPLPRLKARTCSLTSATAQAANCPPALLIPTADPRTSLRAISRVMSVSNLLAIRFLRPTFCLNRNLAMIL